MHQSGGCFISIYGDMSTFWGGPLLQQCLFSDAACTCTRVLVVTHMYMHLHMCTCVHVVTHMCMHLHTYTCSCTHIHALTHMYM